MVITSAAQALAWLNNANEEPAYREAAVRYLKDNLVPGAIARLVQALQDDELGVRWEAALALSQLAELAVPEVLIALVDPKRVGDPRLRAGAYHVLRDSHLTLPSGTAALLEALKGPAADIATMIEANRLLIQIEKQRARQGREFSRPGSTKARPPMPSSAPEMRYGLAQLTGRLRRLKKYRSI